MKELSRIAVACQQYHARSPHGFAFVYIPDFVTGGLMISRRRFLEAGSVAGVVAVSWPLLAADSPEKTGGASLPEPVARLQSRKGEAAPITHEERQQRQEPARQVMR